MKNIVTFSSKNLKYSEVVRTLHFDPIEVEYEDRVEEDIYKVEIIKNHLEEYRILLYRLDFYTVKPSFYDDHADEMLWILDATHKIDPETIVESTGERALQILIDRLTNFYETCKIKT